MLTWKWHSTFRCSPELPAFQSSLRVVALTEAFYIHISMWWVVLVWHCIHILISLYQHFFMWMTDSTCIHFSSQCWVWLTDKSSHRGRGQRLANDSCSMSPAHPWFKGVHSVKTGFSKRNRPSKRLLFGPWQVVGPALSNPMSGDKYSTTSVPAGILFQSLPWLPETISMPLYTKWPSR